MSLNLNYPRKYYTYEDFLAIDDEHRYELYDGEIYMLASPSSRHQEISVELIKQIAVFLTGKKCKILHDFDVHLHNRKKDVVFAPDIIIVCDPSKIKYRDCEGAPDVVMEILSPSTSRWDEVVKFNEYLRAGVLEYWIIDPINNFVTTYRLEDGKYVAEKYTNAAPIMALPGCEIDLSLLFPEETANE